MEVGHGWDSGFASLKQLDTGLGVASSSAAAAVPLGQLPQQDFAGGGIDGLGGVVRDNWSFDLASMPEAPPRLLTRSRRVASEANLHDLGKQDLKRTRKQLSGPLDDLDGLDSDQLFSMFMDVEKLNHQVPFSSEPKLAQVSENHPLRADLMHTTGPIGGSTLMSTTSRGMRTSASMPLLAGVSGATGQLVRVKSPGSDSENGTFGESTPRGLGLGSARSASATSLAGSGDPVRDLASAARPRQAKAMGELQMALLDPKRAKRILANRQSAARSKERKLRYISELERRVAGLQAEATALTARMAALQRDSAHLDSENGELRLRLQAIEHQSNLRDALHEGLQKEVTRLKLVTGENTSVGSSSTLHSIQHQRPIQGVHDRQGSHAPGQAAEAAASQHQQQLQQAQQQHSPILAPASSAEQAHQQQQATKPAQTETTPAEQAQQAHKQRHQQQMQQKQTSQVLKANGNINPQTGSLLMSHNAGVAVASASVGATYGVGSC